MFYKHTASFNIFTPMTIFLIVDRCNKFIKVSLLELIRSMIPISEGHINLMRCMARKQILHFKNKTGDKLQSNYLIGLINCHLPVCVRAVRKPIIIIKKKRFSHEAAHNINMK